MTYLYRPGSSLGPAIIPFRRRRREKKTQNKIFFEDASEVNAQG